MEMVFSCPNAEKDVVLEVEPGQRFSKGRVIVRFGCQHALNCPVVASPSGGGGWKLDWSGCPAQILVEQTRFVEPFLAALAKKRS